MHLKLLQKRVIQKIVEATGDLNSNKIANKITGFSKKVQKINQRQLQMNMIKKYTKKNIYLQK